MVIIDTTILLLFFHHNASPPVDPDTQKPVYQFRERVEFLIKTLSNSKTTIAIPTPALSEILLCANNERHRILTEINGQKIFKLCSFDPRAAVELAEITQFQRGNAKLRDPGETKAKLRFDCQILAIAKTNGIGTVYSDDIGLGAKCLSHGIHVLKTCDLPLPPEHPQQELEFPKSEAEPAPP